MKGPYQTLAFATAALALPLFAYSQNASNQDSQSTQALQTPIPGHHEATQMKPARAVLVHTLDADKDHDGSSIQAKLDQKVTLDNGTQLPKGTMLLGEVAKDDMQEQGLVKLAVRFDLARLKDGSTVPVRATILGLYGPDSVGIGSTPDQQTGISCLMPGHRRRCKWIRRTLSRAWIYTARFPAGIRASLSPPRRMTSNSARAVRFSLPLVLPRTGKTAHRLAGYSD